MFRSSLRAGVAGLTRRPGLALLLYGMNLALAFVLAVPVYSALRRTVGWSGFGPELARGFDLGLWADILEEAGVMLRALGAQLFWAALLYVAWKAAAGAGLVHALRDGGGRSFWQGVGRYGGRSLRLSLAFLLPLVAWVLVVFVAALALNALWEGEVGTFWTNAVVVPVLLVIGLAGLDLMQDYARMALVVEEAPVGQAWKQGLQWPFRYGRAVALYLVWLVPAALLLGAPTALDLQLAGATAGGIWLLFLLQQLLLVCRAALTVGWVGSEVALFEHVRRREAPLIAEAQEAAHPPEDADLPDPPHHLHA